MLYEIKDIYNYNKEEESEMLSGFTSSVDPDHDFWKPYRDNFAYFDRIFMKKYRSWFPMDQEGTLEDIAEEFAEDVKGWLMINDKRYSELYRIQTITDDEKYSLTDNVYEHEVIDRDTSSSGSNIKGSETITDTAQNQYGAQADSESKSRTVGQQSDSESKSLVYGQQVIDEDKSKTYGAATKTTENGTSAFNESGYSDTDRSVESDAVHTDTEDNSVTNGSHTDTESNSYTHGSHTDSETNSYSHGTHTDNLSNTRVDGQRTDTSTGTGSEDVERTRSGNIGVRTVDEMLNIHKDVWVDFSFYEMIFAEITRELLRGC